MKKILLIVVTALIAVSTGLSLAPMKVAFLYTSGTPTSVRVQLADNTSNSLFVGENYTTGITPNSSGIVVVNVRDHAGSGTTWADYQASSVNTYSTLDIYVNNALYAQYRLDQLIMAQAQNGILDQDGNLTPAENGKGNIGTDELRWSSGYFEGETVHIGPADGEANNTEMALSYDDATNTGSIAIDNESVIDATKDLITINKLVSQEIGDNNTAFGTGALVNNTGQFVDGVGINAARENSGDYVNASGLQAAYQNTGTYVNASGYRAAYQNTGSNVNARGYWAARGNKGLNLNASGYYSASENTGNHVNASGFFAAYRDTGDYVNASGYNAARENSGSYVNAFGRDAAHQNAGDNVNASGIQSCLSKYGFTPKC